MKTIPIKIISKVDCEKAEFVVCCLLPDLKYFKGNIETECIFCGRGIYHRPYLPKKPPKICLDCAVEMKHE